VPVFEQLGFVVCSGHQWLRATNATIHFLQLVLEQCRNHATCDDQVAYNLAILNTAHIKWDPEPNRSDAPRIEGHGQMHGLLIEQLTGQSRVTNHTIKIWDRDFATRWLGDPDICPSLSRNWVAMPTQMPSVTAKAKNKIQAKMMQMDAWIELCGPHGSRRTANSTLLPWQLTTGS